MKIIIFSHKLTTFAFIFFIIFQVAFLELCCNAFYFTVSCHQTNPFVLSRNLAVSPIQSVYLNHYTVTESTIAVCL